MSTTVKETVTVAQLSKYGVKIGEEYYNWSKHIKEVEKGCVSPGGTYEMDLYIADSGKKYINSVTSTERGAAVALKPVAKATTVEKVKPKVESVMSKDEWAAKDLRISRQGLIQAAFIALAPVVSLDQLFLEASKLAEQGLEFVNKK